MSTIQANLIEPSSGTTVTFGASGDTVAVGSGATASGFSGGLDSVQTFTSSGTWTRPSGITKVIMEVQGAGGGGSHGTQNIGGAGGGYCKKFLDVSSISTSTITVGAAGAAVANGSTGSGGNGGASSWADGTNTVTGAGGAGGNQTSGYSAGGTGTGGDINIAGVSISIHKPTTGGDSFLGGAGMYLHSGASAGVGDGTGYGGGGSAWSGYSLPTGAGAPGIVIVWEYK